MNIYPSSLIEAIDTGSGVIESFEVNGVSVPIAKMRGYIPLDFLQRILRLSHLPTCKCNLKRGSCLLSLPLRAIS